MTEQVYKKHAWYTYINGKIKRVFYCIDIDGEYLMFNRTQGYSLTASHPATEKEIKEEKERMK